MFREMRRKKQLLTMEETEAIFKRGTSGVLAVEGDGGYPYTVPLSYFYADSKIYFHSAKSGHKVDAIKKNDKASFCVVDQDEIVPEKFTTYFRSAVAFGRVRILEDREDIISALNKLGIKYSPNESDERRMAEIEGDMDNMYMMEFSIEHMTGKEAIELVKEK